MTRQPTWEDLLARSEELVRKNQDLPLVERDIHQMEVYSERL
ncbi:hypothetical protein H632_c4589p0, partial [Helicosporidium sp. ATCC 50920]